MSTHTAAPNPVVKTTALRAYPGWIIREYANGMFDARDTNGISMSPGESSFMDALYFVKHGEPIVHSASDEYDFDVSDPSRDQG